MTVSICIGSACHLNGSYDVKNIFQELIKFYQLDDKVTLEVAFCLGHCKDGVTIKINDEIITGLSKNNAEIIFRERVLSTFQTTTI